MTDTTHLGLPFIDGSQAQKHVTHNEALRILDAAIQIGVEDTTLMTPPETPPAGARYLVPGGASGAWSGQAQAIACWEDGAWRFLAPKMGWCVWSAADEMQLVFDGATWRHMPGGEGTLGAITELGINATPDDDNRLRVCSNAALFSAIDAADGGTGDMRIQISKEGADNVASVVFSDAFSGCAEFGLIGSDAFKLKVSDDGTAFTEAFIIDQATGNLTLPRGFALSGVVSPATITADQDDYDPAGLSTCSVLQLSTDAARAVSGLAGGIEGRVLAVLNVGSQGVVLCDEGASSAAANRFAFGDDIVLGPKHAAVLRYDGTAARWFAIVRSDSASGGGGGGGDGLSDTDRRNILLDRIYQSKLLGAPRRVIKAWATGFKAATDADRGINAGASSNVDVSNAASSGYVKPTSGAGSYVTQISQNLTMNGSGWGGLTLRQIIPPGGAGVTGKYLKLTLKPSSSGNNSSVAAVYVGHTSGGGSSLDFDGTQVQVKFGGANSVTLTAGGSAVVSDPVAYNYDNAKYLIVTIYFSGTSDACGFAKGALGGGYAAYYKSGNDAGTTAGTGYSASSSYDLTTVSKIETAAGIFADMTLTTLSQTTDASVSNARALIEFDNVDVPTLNTDLIVEVTCDGGTNWSAATLSSVTAYSQSGRKVAETADTACTAGASFAARVKTANGKNVPIYGGSVAVH
jgi:hypothetical protein